MANRLFCRACILLLALCFLLAAPAAWAAPSPFSVLRYDTRLDIETSGDIIVTEDITIHVPTSGTNKGIIRDIPVNPRWQELGRQDVELTVESVTLDGKPCNTDDTELAYPVLSIYMRDRASYLDAGEHRFVLRYRMSEQIGFFEENDELTWNAVGNGWEGGVAQARAVVLPPPGTDFTQHRAWLGEKGSHDSPVRTSKERIGGREALVFEAVRPIMEGEVFTVAVAWPVGIVTQPDIHDPAEQWGYTLFYMACLLGSLAAAYKLWDRCGRDPKAGAVIPLFYPPRVPQRLRAEGAAPARAGRRQRPLHGEEYMTPVAVHYVHEGGKLEERGLAALFLSLAQRGDCSLRGTAKKGIVVEKHANSSPAPEESAAAGKIPERLSLSPRKTLNSPIGNIYNACKLRLDFDYPMEVEWNLLPQIGLFILVAAAVACSAYCQVESCLSELVIRELAETASGLLMLLGGVAGAAFLICSAVRNRIFSLRLIGMVLLSLFIAYSGCTTLGDADSLWIFSPLQWGLMFAALLPPIVFGFLMDLPSREQVRLKQEIKGLALYIGTAETARFNMLNPPEENLQLYHRLLPYAVALGLEDAWGKRFADKLAQALASETSAEEFYTTDFTIDLVRGSRVSLGSYREAVVAEQAARAAKYASSSGGGSSFSGFGGGAGSGGGGGGGRAC